MKRTDGLVQCRCKEWRTPEDLCSDGSCIYCEDVVLDDDEPTEFELAFDVNDLADGYVLDDDDEEEDW